MEKELKTLQCETCNGEGYIWKCQPWTDPATIDKEMCIVCNGTGIISNSEGD